MFVLFCFKKIVRELENKKPQLDEIISIAEALKGEENHQQLQNKGK